VLEAFRELNMAYPEVSAERLGELKAIRKQLTETESQEESGKRSEHVDSIE